MSSEQDPSQRIVVTGMGCVSPLGLDVETSWQRIINNEDAIINVSNRFSEYPQLKTSVAAPVDNFDFIGEGSPFARGVRPNRIQRLHKSAQFSIWAAYEALNQAALIMPSDEAHRPYVLNPEVVDPTRVGVRVGTGIGGTEQLAPARILINQKEELPKNFTILQVLPERVASAPSMFFGAKGPVAEMTAACASGNINIIDAARLLKLDEADVVIAGGSEAQATPESVALFEAIRALDSETTDPAEASRPFHNSERGFVIGEGAGIIVLETLAHAQRRGAAVLAFLEGYGESADAMSDTDPSGEGAVRAMKLALSNLEIRKDEGIYVNAHATGTGGDKVELGAIREVLDPDTVAGISSTKGAVGHMLGAAGAFEAIISIKALQDSVIPPSLKQGDDPLPATKEWMIPTEATKAPLYRAVNTSFGFGGLNAVTVFGHAE